MTAMGPPPLLRAKVHFWLVCTTPKQHRACPFMATKPAGDTTKTKGQSLSQNGYRCMHARPPNGSAFHLGF